MNWYKFTFTTQCGKTKAVVQQADTLAEAKDKVYKHNILTHTPMQLKKIELENNNRWFQI